MNFWKKFTDESLLEETWKLKRQLSEQLKSYKEAERRIDKLKISLESIDVKFQQLSAEKGRMEAAHEGHVTKLTMDFTRSADVMTNKYDQDMATQGRNHQKSVQRLTAEHGANVSSLKEHHGMELSELTKKMIYLKSDHASDMAKLEEERTREASALKDDHSRVVNNLLGQLLANQDDDQAWPDDVLKLKFRELQRKIEMVTSPRALNIPTSQQLGLQLDPTNFTVQAGRGKAHFLIKSKIWAIVNEQFFAVPFGYGSLGRGQGERDLMGIYSTWRKLVEGHFESDSVDDNQFAVFQREKLANKWRSATFQSIYVALTGNAGNIRGDSPLAKLSRENVRRTVERIMGVLVEVAKLSNSSVQSETEHEIRQMADLARDIALQFGINPAQLRVVVPHHDEQVQIGEEYHDCEDGDCSFGSFARVGLLVVPGLQKIGDGRSEMHGKRIIVPCEIYPAQ